MPRVKEVRCDKRDDSNTWCRECGHATFHEPKRDVIEVDNCTIKGPCVWGEKGKRVRCVEVAP